MTGEPDDRPCGEPEADQTAYAYSSTAPTQPDDAETRPLPPGPTDEQTRPMIHPAAPAGSGTATTRPGQPDGATAPPTRTAPTPSGESTPRPEIPAAWDTLANDGQLEPGQVVFGRYMVKKRIGGGGMGDVWLVRHLTLDVDRALKTITANIAFDAQARARFRREAQVMARFSHPNAVTVHDALLSRDVAFIEMEYVCGHSLNELIPRGTPMPLDWVARILKQLCDVLQVAHEHNIVHRDLKPANLMLVDGRPPGEELLKVLDFGIAKILGAEEGGEGDVRTLTNTFMGTPPYTSPEQANGHADPRSDVYSVGVILYEWLTGHRPFSGPVAKLIADTLNIDPPPFRVINPNALVPEPVEGVVMRSLAKDPAERPQSARELCEVFWDALPGETRTLTRPSPVPFRPPPKEGTPRRRWLAVASGVGLLAAVAAGGVYFGLDGRGGRTPAGDLTSGTTVPKPDFPKPKGDQAESSRPAAFEPPRHYRAEWPGGHPAPGVRPVLVHESGLRLIPITGGAFTMGGLKAQDEEHPPAEHTETVADFYLQDTEVTNGQFRRYLRETRDIEPQVWRRQYDLLMNKHQLSEAEADEHPAVGIDHDTAERFAIWAGGRLPTSAEWEFAARSGGKPGYLYVWGAGPHVDQVTPMANLDSRGRPGPATNTVRYVPKDVTEHGIFDLTGNVREWCQDRSLGSQPSQGMPQQYVVRGGSWNSNARLFATTAFEDLPANEALEDLGFRIAMDAPKLAESP